LTVVGVFRKGERAAERLLARLALERPAITLPQLRDAAAALIDLPAPDAHARLAALCTPPLKNDQR
jgi:hypothetical protein